MKKVALLIILGLIPSFISAQDFVIKKNGKRIFCKVLSIDSTFVHIQDSQDLLYSIHKNDVNEIQYGKESIATAQPKLCSVTIGILEGGGSLAGIDVEFLLTRSLGLQFGTGFVGFGSGLNLHFKPTIRSSFLSLQYWHQGFRQTYTQSLLGPCYVFRAKKIFTGQLGLGFLLEQGPNWPENKVQPPVMLTYAIGFYFPY